MFEGNRKKLHKRRACRRMAAVAVSLDPCGWGGKIFKLINDRIEEIETDTKEDLWNLSSANGRIYAVGDNGPIFWPDPSLRLASLPPLTPFWAILTQFEPN